MSLKLVAILTVIIFIASCATKKEIPTTTIEGKYSGVFQRNGNTSIVEFIFTENSFSGKSNIAQYPAICEGTYTIDSDSIRTSNGCMWTANFDWSLIFDNQWSYTIKQDSLILSNEKNDLYNLVKYQDY